MTSESENLRDFLSSHHPFDQLPEEALEQLAEELQPRQVVADAALYEPGSTNQSLYIIRHGAVEVRDAANALMARLGEGDVFGHRPILRGGLADNSARAMEDSELLEMPVQTFARLRRTYSQFNYYFAPVGAERLREGIQMLGPSDRASINLLGTAVGEVVTRAPVTVSGDTSVRMAAERMSSERVSSLLVVEDGDLAGIVTDRDLRNRVVAKALDYDSPVATIMTASPITVDADSVAFEALLSMARGGLNHLPVIRDGNLEGMVTSTDLVRRHSTSPLFVVSDVHKCTGSEQLAQVSSRLPELLRILVDGHASARSIGQVITSVGEAITLRLLQIAERELGPTPIPYAWIACGSQARREQTAHSDQDNCLLLADDYREPEHGEYFQRLARIVCDGLNACGYVYCPGEVMAITDQWRQPLSTWKRYYDKWIDQPDPKALLNASVFFDLRRLHGDQSLFEALQSHYLPNANKNRIFQAFLAANALQFQPPLGLFRNFVLVRSSEHDNALDLKRRGVVPIIDMARVYTLSTGGDALNTFERLEDASKTGALSRSGGEDLRDALEFIGSVRLRHQAQQIRDQIQPDNYMRPEDLSHFERNHLKDAFAVVRTMQSAMAHRFQTGRFG